MIKLYYYLLLIITIISQSDAAKYFETKRCLIECKHQSHTIRYCQHLSDLAFKICLMTMRDLPKNCVKICVK